MIDTVRNFAIDYQDWASQQSQSYGEVAAWSNLIQKLAELADDDGSEGLVEELRENGII